jgi:hypothetical protein
LARPSRKYGTLSGLQNICSRNLKTPSLLAPTPIGID